MNLTGYACWPFIRGPVRWAGSLFALAVVLLLVGCDAGGAAPATAVPPAEPTATTAPAPVDTATTAPAPAQATPAPPAVKAELYDHAPDYSFIAGQLRQEGTCWIVTYISPLTALAPDQYNNQMALLPGEGWNPADFKTGAWVIVQGQPDAGTDPAAGCPAHGYQVTVMQLNPKTPKASDTLR